MYRFKKTQLKTEFKKVPKIILEALKYSKEPQGSTYGAIKKYIRYKYENYKLAGETIESVVVNGVKTGIIKRNGMFFKLNPRHQKLRMQKWLQFNCKKSSLPVESNRSTRKKSITENNQFLNGTGWNIMKITQPGANAETVTGFVIKALEELQKLHSSSSLNTLKRKYKKRFDEIMQQKASSEKVAKLIIEAIHDLQEPEGSSLTTIKRYITIRYGNRKLRDRIIPQAIEDGVQCGLIKKTGNLYKLDTYLIFLAQKRFQFMKKKKTRRKTKKNPSPSNKRKHQKRKTAKTKLSKSFRTTSNMLADLRPGTSPEESYPCIMSSLSDPIIAGMNINTSKGRTRGSNVIREKRKEIDDNNSFELFSNTSARKTQTRIHKRKSSSFSSALSSFGRKRRKSSKHPSLARKKGKYDKTKSYEYSNSQSIYKKIRYSSESSSDPSTSNKEILKINNYRSQSYLNTTVQENSKTDVVYYNRKYSKRRGKRNKSTFRRNATKVKTPETAIDLSRPTSSKIERMDTRSIIKNNSLNSCIPDNNSGSQSRRKSGEKIEEVNILNRRPKVKNSSQLFSNPNTSNKEKVQVQQNLYRTTLFRKRPEEDREKLKTGLSPSGIKKISKFTGSNIKNLSKSNKETKREHISFSNRPPKNVKIVKVDIHSHSPPTHSKKNSKTDSNSLFITTSEGNDVKANSASLLPSTTYKKDMKTNETNFLPSPIEKKKINPANKISLQDSTKTGLRHKLENRGSFSSKISRTLINSRPSEKKLSSPSEIPENKSIDKKRSSRLAMLRLTEENQIIVVKNKSEPVPLELLSTTPKGSLSANVGKPGESDTLISIPNIQNPNLKRNSAEGKASREKVPKSTAENTDLKEK